MATPEKKIMENGAEKEEGEIFSPPLPQGEVTLDENETNLALDFALTLDSLLLQVFDSDSLTDYLHSPKKKQKTVDSIALPPCGAQLGNDTVASGQGDCGGSLDGCPRELGPTLQDNELDLSNFDWDTSATMLEPDIVWNEDLIAICVGGAQAIGGDASTVIQPEYLCFGDRNLMHVRNTPATRLLYLVKRVGKKTGAPCDKLCQLFKLLWLDLFPHLHATDLKAFVHKKGSRIVQRAQICTHSLHEGQSLLYSEAVDTDKALLYYLKTADPPTLEDVLQKCKIEIKELMDKINMGLPAPPKDRVLALQSYVDHVEGAMKASLEDDMSKAYFESLNAKTALENALKRLHEHNPYRL